MNRPLSQRQEQILQFIRDFMDDHRYPPTVRDIQGGCNISSTSVVDYNLHKLEERGYMRREREVSRGIELVGEGRPDARDDIVSVPVMGNIAAGELMHVPDAAGNVDENYDSVELPSSMAGAGSDAFALRVKGTSMIDALVADGDLVVLRPATQANNGEMVAAWVESLEETTLKRFYLEGDMVRLQPANETMPPILVPAKDVSVRGRVVGVIRTL
ncbi:MAG: transcriptional repressor LexA [SAR202 cluster bacterium]|jgi:repressor LexA|nr:transcriptional repressor LexA [SAR202 cluster bacterium]MDP6301032.1 transcriptional repressor LexA [SAR202 cluster bacterium]MDP7104510.1 transcriptional repressor LexA [SAR202 cluster bacterium]MDP7226847.1 transcriptional repressor LexA [SAR202 cluster bacterium]MDP7413848.1 transcriptional repressor LexA [SAR202 cluster bacterium]|tara:strand:+ start:3106 stop:3750 length:645 start_codon:yes stop_codon:yes gene_type:complete